MLQTLQLPAQVAENFSDNELTQNPLWAGDVDHFMVESEVLQLRAPAESSVSFLSTANSIGSGAAWECSIAMAFNPSTSNFCRLYLLSDNENLNSPLNGYFVQVGGADDDVSLFRQTGTTRSKIIDGPDDLLNNDLNNITIRVTRSAQGEWQLYARGQNENNLSLLGTASDSEFPPSAFAGIQCFYTSTRADKFSFDDFMVSPLEDLELPRMQNVTVLTQEKIRIGFSEAMDRSSVEDPSHYQTDAGVVHDIVLDETNPSLAFLTVSTAMDPWKSYRLIAEGILDLAGNALARDTISFIHSPIVRPEFKQIVITEIMADPSPAIGLPEVEFIELFNRGSIPVNLSGWTIADGSTTGSLMGEIVLPPREYILLAASPDSEVLAPYGNVIPVNRFPSLNNSGDHVILKDHEDRTIDSVQYQTFWYKDSGKTDGGWSLEIIDPDNLCEGEGNWSASVHPSGGTPGHLNAVDADNPDLKGPELILAYAIYPDTIRLVFNETLSRDLPARTRFSIAPSRELIQLAWGNSFKAIDLIVDPKLIAGEIMTVGFEGIYDCSGNVHKEGPGVATVVLPEEADSLDVVINEILFNPRANGVDFVEIFNASEKYIGLGKWALVNFHDGVRTNEKDFDQHLVLKPADYAALTPDREVLLSEYPSAVAAAVYETDLPPLNDDSGSIALIDQHGNVIDHAEYSEDRHSVFLKEKEGVSLERISARAPSFDTDNWKSAGAQSGYATPGSRNSNSKADVLGNDGEVVLNPEIFVPASGEQDFTSIEYNFENGGFIGTIAIYDQHARIVKTIGENILLGTSGFFRWDGDRDDGTRATVGNYMVRFEVFNSQGVVKVIRKRVAIAGRF